MSRFTGQAGEPFYLALLAFGEQDFERAVTYARQAVSKEPDNPVFAQAAIYLERVRGDGKPGAYVTGKAFASFIRGGGNIPLYQQTSAALRRVYEEYEILSLLDIGVGDGLALLPALTDNIHPLNLIEPSEAMLQQTRGNLVKRGIPHQAFCGTLQDFVLEQVGNWDVIQATYSLQSIRPQERPALLQWLREHSQRFLMAEFDVPDFGAMYDRDWVDYVVSRYENGLAEYVEDGGLVAQGFLMPVLFGYFDPTLDRTNYEQPLQKWVDELKSAGFRTVETYLLYDYWWAPAYFLDAS